MTVCVGQVFSRAGRISAFTRVFDALWAGPGCPAIQFVLLACATVTGWARQTSGNSLLMFSTFGASLMAM